MKYQTIYLFLFLYFNLIYIAKIDYVQYEYTINEQKKIKSFVVDH